MTSRRAGCAVAWPSRCRTFLAIAVSCGVLITDAFMLLSCSGSHRHLEERAPSNPQAPLKLVRQELKLPRLSGNRTAEILSLLPPDPIHVRVHAALTGQGAWTPRFVTVTGPVPEFYEVVALAHEYAQQEKNAERSGQLALELLGHAVTAIDASLGAVESLSPDHPVAQDTIGHLISDLAELEVLTWRVVAILGDAVGVEPAQLVDEPLPNVIERLVADGLRHPSYMPLKRALGECFTLLSRLEARGQGDIVLNDEHPWGELSLGAQASYVEPLRARLLQLGYREARSTLLTTFDAPLKDALLALQAKHNLPETGQPDEATRAVLSVPIRRRLVALQSALKLLRHHPHRKAPIHIELNIPTYELRVVGEGEILGRYRVIVGSNRRDFDPISRQTGHLNRTPKAVTALEAVVINPSWKVPHRVKLFELDPRAERDPGFYDAFDMVRSPEGEPHLVQRPGPTNALGLVQFLLAGHQDLSLHDTPGKDLFRAAYRALTHGSVRIENAMEFATMLLTLDGQQEASKRLSDLVMTKNRTELALKKAVPLLIYYSLIDVDAAGTVKFYPDVYRPEEPKALNEEPVQDAR